MWNYHTYYGKNIRLYLFVPSSRAFPLLHQHLTAIFPASMTHTAGQPHSKSVFRISSRFLNSSPTQKTIKLFLKEPMLKYKKKSNRNRDPKQVPLQKADSFGILKAHAGFLVICICKRKKWLHRATWNMNYVKEYANKVYKTFCRMIPPEQPLLIEFLERSLLLLRLIAEIPHQFIGSPSRGTFLQSGAGKSTASHI